MGLLQARAVCHKIYVDDSSIIRTISIAFVVEPSTKAFPLRTVRLSSHGTLQDEITRSVKRLELPNDMRNYDSFGDGCFLGVQNK